MHKWVLSTTKPFVLPLASDSQFSQTDFSNDQIWELTIHHGDPPGLSLETTYGLRARKQRIFPRFKEGDQVTFNPAEFKSDILVRLHYPNYVQINFSPLKEIEATLEYWVPDSHSVGGRVKLKNVSNQNRQLILSWVSLLSPSDGGSRMALNNFENVSVLSGKSGELTPVMFLRDGAYPASGPFPALELSVELKPNQEINSVCVLASLNDALQSFEKARKIASCNWDSEFSKIIMVNKNYIEVITGEPEWDLVFERSQTIARGLLHSPTDFLPGMSFVQTRHPDQGFSYRGDGSDYNHLWNGQTVLHSWFISQELLPMQTQLAVDLISNLMASQISTGMVDCKPGLGNQRSAMTATPLLAHFVWSIFKQTQETELLEKLFIPLKKAFEFWFTSEMDKDQDGLPEWEHSWQTGLEDHPLFSYWISNPKGFDITTFECPSLNSMLYLDGQALLSIAEIIGELTSKPTLKSRIETLKKGVLNSWDESKSMFQYKDFQSHQSADSQTIYNGLNSGNLSIRQSFTEPVRLHINYQRHSESTRRITIFIHGISSTGENRIERISPDQLHWHMAHGFVTSQRMFTNIERILIEGGFQEDQLIISTVEHTFQDISLFFPIYAKIPDIEQTNKLIHQNLLNETLFLHPAGLANYPKAETSDIGEINIIWNTFVVRGLLEYNLLTEAAGVMTKILNTLARSLRNTGGFRRVYHPISGKGIGERNSLQGLAPLGSFLKLVGIEFIDPWRIKVQGINPFPWPVTVKYCGTTVLKNNAKTTVVFPAGQTITINDEDPHILALE